MLLLLLAIPVLGTGAVAWWAMQHRSSDGAFHGEFAPIELPHRILVVPDVDALLWRDAAFTRAGDTSLKLSASAEHATVFMGLAPPAEVASLLSGVPYTELTDVRVGRGPLPSGSRQFDGTAQLSTAPELQKFWLRSGTGTLEWQPAADRGKRVALVVVVTPTAPATQAGALRLDAGLTVAWLNSTTWGLLILGPVLLLLGFAALAWPHRPREIVYVVDPAVAAQAGLPQPATPALPAWHLNQPSFFPPSSAVYASSSATRPPSIPEPTRPSIAETASVDHEPVSAAEAGASSATAGESSSAAGPEASSAAASSLGLSRQASGSDTARNTDGVPPATGAPAQEAGADSATKRTDALDQEAGAADGAASAANRTSTDALDQEAGAALAANRTSTGVPAQIADGELAWPPPEAPQATDAPRDLPMPVVGLRFTRSGS